MVTVVVCFGNGNYIVSGFGLSLSIPLPIFTYTHTHTHTHTGLNSMRLVVRVGVWEMMT